MSCYSCDRKKCTACNYEEELQFPKHLSKPYIMIPTDGSMTNGDVIKAMFSQLKIIGYMETTKKKIVVALYPKDSSHDFDLDWWDAPYKGRK